MPVSDQHRLYTANRRRWELVRDCVEGSAAIKNRRAAEGDSSNKTVSGNIAGTRYLPQPNPNDNSQENVQRYDQYKTRANFVNFTSHTRDGFLGMVFRVQPSVELPVSIEHLNDSADGSGKTLLQMSQNTVSDCLETGRQGLLVDFPVSEGGTRAQTSELKATIKEYSAESIINWRTEAIDGKAVLTMVVLAEEIERIEDDQFSVTAETWHRVLWLVDGVYTQQVYNKDDELVEDGILPRKSDSSTWSEIPFVFVGAEDNGVTPDKAPLYDLAEVNIAHYRNSADFEEAAFFVGQPTVTIAGLTQAWVDQNMKSGLFIGSRAIVPLPEGGSADMLQASPNQMPSEGMKDKEQQMVQIGAKIITDSRGVETAEAAKLRFAGQNSKLSMVINNVQAAYMQCFQWALEFMGGGTGDIEFDINRQFYESSADPQLLVAAMQLQDRAIIAKSDTRQLLRKQALIALDRTDDDIDQEVGEVDPLA